MDIAKNLKILEAKNLQKLKERIDRINIQLETLLLHLQHAVTREKISSEIKELKDTKNQLDLTEIYRPFHPTTLIPIILKCMEIHKYVEIKCKIR